MGDSGQRGVQPHKLADVVLAALRRWPSRDGKRYAMSLLAGTIGAAHDGYRPNGVVLCSFMRNAVIRIRQGGSAADPHFADPYDYVEVDTYLPGGANQLPKASSLEGVRLLALGSCFPEDAAAAPASAPPGLRRPLAPRRPVGVRLRSSSSRAEFCEGEDGVGGSPVVPWDPMAPPVALLGTRSPGAAAAREHDPARGVRVGEVANPGPWVGGVPALRASVLDWRAEGLRFRGGPPRASHGGVCRDGFGHLPLDERGLAGGRWRGGRVGRRAGLTLPPGGCPTWR